MLYPTYVISLLAVAAAVTGPKFRQKIQAIVEAFTSMENDLNSEKKVMNKHWARREGEINRVMMSTVGLYGDLQGIAGANIPEIEGLGMEALGEPDPVVRVFGALDEPEEKA